MGQEAAIRRTNLRALKKGPRELARLTGKTYSYFRDLLEDERKSFGERAARAIEQAIGLPHGWLDAVHLSGGSAATLASSATGAGIATPRPAPRAAGVSPQTGGQTPAHYDSTPWQASPEEDTSPLLNWGELSMHKQERAKMPARFRLKMTDDAMAPRAPAGALLTFERDETERPGDGVLVRDAAGHCYVRLFKPRRADLWEAHALHPDVLPLASDRDGLEVLGVLVAVAARWG